MWPGGRVGGWQACGGDSGGGSAVSVGSVTETGQSQCGGDANGGTDGFPQWGGLQRLGEASLSMETLPSCYRPKHILSLVESAPWTELTSLCCCLFIDGCSLLLDHEDGHSAWDHNRRL